MFWVILVQLIVFPGHPVSGMSCKATCGDHTCQRAGCMSEMGFVRRSDDKRLPVSFLSPGPHSWCCWPECNSSVFEPIICWEGLKCPFWTPACSQRSHHQPGVTFVHLDTKWTVCMSQLVSPRQGLSNNVFKTNNLFHVGKTQVQTSTHPCDEAPLCSALIRRVWLCRTYLSFI